MKTLIPIYSEGTVDQDLVQEGQRNLTDYFQKKGYYDVKVTTEYRSKPDRNSCRLHHRSWIEAQGGSHSFSRELSTVGEGIDGAGLGEEIAICGRTGASARNC